MTDEEIQKIIQDISESIDKLSGSEKLTKEETSHKRVLLLRKEILEKIKEARESNDKKGELTNTITYSLLTSWGDKHPFLMHIVRSKMGISLME